MSDSIDNVTANWEQDGELLVKELDRVVLSKGAWATVAFKLQELDRKTGTYGGAKISLRRYKKMSGEYRQQSKFNISSLQQAAQLRDVLSKWVEEGEPEPDAEQPESL